MVDVALSATPKGSGFQGSITYSYGISMSSAETFPAIPEDSAAAAIKILEMPECLDELD